MAGYTIVTALEEMQRYYRKAKVVAQPIVDKMLPKDEANEAVAENETPEERFNEDANGKEDGWVDVVESEETPAVSYRYQSHSKNSLTVALQEDNQENHRLANGTGPIEVASGIFRQKITEMSTVAVTKASQAPGIMRTCVENQVERLAEGVGRASVSETVTAVLQRYPLLERWRVAFFRGRDRGGRAVAARSPPPEPRPSTEEVLQPAAQPASTAGEGDMEDVPLENDELEEKEDSEQLV